MTALLALLGGASLATAVLAAGGVSPAVAARPAVATLRRVWSRHRAATAEVRLSWLTASTLLLCEVAGAMVAGCLALALSGLAVLGVAACVLGAAVVKAASVARVKRLRRARQDATLEAVRTLRQLLETGAVGVQQAIAVLAEKGPPELRAEFRTIASAAGAARQREAWLECCERLSEPLFDMLAAAILVQRPSGGELVPLFGRLEESVTAIYEVTRESEALGVQARSAAALILSLPLVFLSVLAMLRSPYLDAYRQPTGEVFLSLMLLVMGSTYLLILRWLRLPEQPRLKLDTAGA